MEQFDCLVLSVSQLNNYIKGIIDEIPAFRHLYVSGEISNFTNHYRSGHYYFALKDDTALIKAVMFRTYASGLKFMPENGMEVLVKARLSVFERDGVYQLYVEDIQPKGYGSLSLAYEQLRKKLSAEGLFDEKYKKALPLYPEKIGVITSPTGAAVRDITNILKRRYPIAEIVLEPVQVQGESAASQLRSAVQKINAEKSCDVIIIGRGGGSTEDLWAFNDESLARTIFASKIPVISAVGHETDFTICDFVADLRAPTPSAAAELAVPNLEDVKSLLQSRQKALKQAVQEHLSTKRLALERIKMKPCLRDAGFIIDENRLKIDSLTKRLDSACASLVQEHKTQLIANAAKLEALSPLKVLARGYSVVKKGNKVITKAQALCEKDTVTIRFLDGSAQADITQIN